MPHRFQFSLATTLLITTCCALALGLVISLSWRQWEISEVQRENHELRVRLGMPPRHTPEAVIREWPMTISLSEWGDFSTGHSWNLSVNAAGDAVLTVHTSPANTTKLFQVSEAQLTELRNLLIRERFFRLADGYGEQVLDGSTSTITIALGEFAKTVHIQYLMDWVHSEPEKLREPARAVRVEMLIRSWFQHPNAVDSTQYNQRVLDTVERLEKSVANPGLPSIP